MGKPFTLLQEIFETGSILQKLWNESPFNFSFLSKTINLTFYLIKYNDNLQLLLCQN